MIGARGMQANATVVVPASTRPIRFEIEQGTSSLRLNVRQTRLVALHPITDGVPNRGRIHHSFGVQVTEKS